MKNFVIACGFPSCSTSKSSALRSVTALPLLSVTTASTCTRLTLIRMTPGGGGPCCAEDCVARMHTKTDIADIAINRQVVMKALPESRALTLRLSMQTAKLNCVTYGGGLVSGYLTCRPVIQPERFGCILYQNNPKSCALEPLRDEVLFEQMRDGRTDALGVLFDRYSRLVFDIAKRILRDPGEAEDFTADATLILLAERHGSRQVVTLDRRGFRIFRLEINSRSGYSASVRRLVRAPH